MKARIVGTTGGMTALLLGNWLLAAGQASNTLVRLGSGTLQGQTLPDGGAVFKGIPYAAAPTGERRWLSPQPVSNWPGVRDAMQYRAPCEQPALGWNDSLIGAQSEDCLYLNVWTPSLQPAARLPVMVWIHGGAFVGGAGTDAVFAGGELSKKGVVLVTLNYRLGIFGFFAHPVLSRNSVHQSSGNFGLEDQLAALDWVDKNIAAFGGDPKNVTIFGQSAGGMSVVVMLASSLTEGKFQHAIVESGAILGGPPLRTLQEAESAGEQFAGTEGIRELRALPAGDLMQRTGSYLASHRETRFGPTIDHYVLNEDPSTTFEEHREHSLPLIIGNNAREGFGRLSEEGLAVVIKRFYGAAAGRALVSYGAEAANPPSPDPVLGSAADQWITDTSFRCSAVVMAAWHAATGAPVYSYHFEQSIPGKEADGAAHSYELPYVFGNLLSEGPLAGGYSAADRRLSSTIVDYWTNFAKSGDPNSRSLPQWPTFNHPSRPYVRLSGALPQGAQPAAGLRRAQCDLFGAKVAKASPRAE
jgi:para-nitrobenzyl esterase